MRLRVKVEGLGRGLEGRCRGHREALHTTTRSLDIVLSRCHDQQSVPVGFNQGGGHRTICVNACRTWVYHLLVV